jgi:formylglycine-generating enzyme required for sulfatase activity
MSSSPTRQAEGASSFRFLLTHRRRATGYREPLGLEARSLTMLWIPPGRFWMGSPPSEPERREAEGPQHLVQLEGFFLAQTPITQAQWREVAGWEKVKRELDPEPSFFMDRPQSEPSRKAAMGKKAGEDQFRISQILAREATFRLLEGEASTDERPVEHVSWHDAMEFCARLSQRTGRRYTLPSEAQWEYACRAGTTTPFHFGETITSELANYDASSTYGNGPKGVYRKQTTPVGLFPANAWGLQDMHGNVWEWCLDYWHESYEGAPEDGRPWLEGEGLKGDESSERSRLLRGGSWFNRPRGCRSAFRHWNLPVNRDGSGGFRVCCLPPGLPS